MSHIMFFASQALRTIQANAQPAYPVLDSAGTSQDSGSVGSGSGSGSGSLTDGSVGSGLRPGDSRSPAIRRSGGVSGHSRGVTGDGEDEDLGLFSHRTRKPFRPRVLDDHDEDRDGDGDATAREGTILRKDGIDSFLDGNRVADGRQIDSRDAREGGDDALVRTVKVREGSPHTTNASHVANTHMHTHMHTHASLM